MYKTTAKRQYRYLRRISIIYVSLLIVSVLLPYRLIDIFGIILPGGILFFPLTYQIGAVVAETYGREDAVKMVWDGILGLFIFNLCLYLIFKLPTVAPGSEAQLFRNELTSNMRLFMGCFAGLIASDLFNVYRITRLKLLYKGRHFLIIFFSTTAISAIIFNIVTYLITYTGVIPFREIGWLIINSWVAKIIISLLTVIPFLYLVYFLKKNEGIDIYDVEPPENLPSAKIDSIVEHLKHLQLQEEKNQEEPDDWIKY